jgi:glycine/D-amino acid oxidase-like deaminating enzyme
MHFKKVAVVGIGLIGGSLAWALKKSGKVGEVFGVDVDKGALSYAVDKGIVDRGSNKIEEVRDSEVVVVATHVRFIPEIVSSLSLYWFKGYSSNGCGKCKREYSKGGRKKTSSLCLLCWRTPYSWNGKLRCLVF